MTQSDKLSIEVLQEILTSAKPDEHEYLDSFSLQIAHQLIDTMRENEELKKFPLKMICAKCNVLTDVDKPNKD